MHSDKETDVHFHSKAVDFKASFPPLPAMLTPAPSPPPRQQNLLKVFVGHDLTLEGWEAFDAAVHCAEISAGEREAAAKAEGQRKKALVQRKGSSSSGVGMLRRIFSRTSSAS